MIVGIDAIIYKILGGGVITGVLVVLFAFVKLYSYKKLNKKRREKNKSKRTQGILLLLASALIFLFEGYCSLDLILQDYITDQGIYEHSYRRGLFVWDRMIICTDNGRSDYFAFSDYVKELEKGQKYEFTYAKRTNVLISIAKIYDDNTMVPVHFEAEKHPRTFWNVLSIYILCSVVIFLLAFFAIVLKDKIISLIPSKWKKPKWKKRQKKL